MLVDVSKIIKLTNKHNIALSRDIIDIQDTGFHLKKNIYVSV